MPNADMNGKKRRRHNFNISFSVLSSELLRTGGKKNIFPDTSTIPEEKTGSDLEEFSLFRNRNRSRMRNRF